MTVRVVPATITWECNRCGQTVEAEGSDTSARPHRWDRVTFQDDFSEDGVDLCHPCCGAVLSEVRAYRKTLDVSPEEASDI